MIDMQRKKAEKLLNLHHSSQLLVLPNIWDVLGAKLLEAAGYEAIATASASVAFSRGLNDNQEIDFSTLLELFQSICNSTSLPVTADIERGYADSNEELAANTENLIECGVVGLNIEDSTAKGEDLVSIHQQCEKIRLIRKVSSDTGVPIVINARTDIFLKKNYTGNKLSDAINRAKNYQDAGADCFYPILCNNEELKEIAQSIEMPINVLLQQDTLPPDELEQMGIARLSLGPLLLRSALTKMREVVMALRRNEGYNSALSADTITSDEVIEIISA